MTAAKRKRLALAAKAVVMSADRGAVVVRDRVVRIADCTAVDSVSLYELCRRWMQDDANARSAPLVVAAAAAAASPVPASSSSSSRAPASLASPSAPLLSLLDAQRRHLALRRAVAAAKRVDVLPALAAAADAPPTAALLREFVDRARVERADWQRQFDERARLAELLLRSRGDPPEQ